MCLILIILNEALRLILDGTYPENWMFFQLEGIKITLLFRASLTYGLHWYCQDSVLKISHSL